MRATMIPPTLVSLFLVLAPALAQSVQPTPSQAAPAQPVPWHPCAKITAACRQAGFVPNGAKVGLGIAVDCIQPIMVGTPQRKQATRALPQIDPQVVLECKQRSPNFGMDGGPIVAFSLRAR